MPTIKINKLQTTAQNGIVNAVKKRRCVMETWKDIDGFEGYYQISNCGAIGSLDRFDGIRNLKGKYLKQSLKQNGYLQVGLRKNGKRKWFSVHRLVAIHFIDNPENKPQVNHIDCDKQNNNVNNLEWVTAKANYKHAERNGLMNPAKGENHPNYGLYGERSKSAKKVVRYNKETGEMKLYNAKILAKYDGFDVTSISKCCNGWQKTHKGYEWYFLEDFNKDIV